MISYEGFKERHYPSKKKRGDYSEDELVSMRENLPEGIVEFLENEGVSSYSNNFLWTAHPGDFHDVLTKWGLPGNECFTFMRSAFGACIYYCQNNFYYLDPLLGRVVSLGDDPYLLLNYSLCLDAILTNGLFEDYYKKMNADRNLLRPDEVFAFAPALPLGGSFEISKVEIVKMSEHLVFLAQLFDGKAKVI